MKTITIPLTSGQWAVARQRINDEQHIEIAEGQTSGEIDKRMKMFWHVDLTWAYGDGVLTIIVVKEPQGFEDKVESTIRDWFKETA